MTTFAEQPTEEGWRVIAIHGAMDAPGTMDIESRIAEYLAGCCDPVIIDVSDVGVLSSYGLRMLLATAKTLKAAGGQLHLFGPGPHVMEIIELSGIDTVLPIHPTRKDAIRALS